MIDQDTIRRALQCIPANLSRDEWARVAMSLKSELPDESGFALFDEWSRGADNYKARAARDTWRSVKPGGGVTIATLMHLARQHGFKGESVQTPAPSPAELAAQADARRKARDREAAERSARQRAAQTAAAQQWQAADETGSSAYLERKRVEPHGVRFAAGGVLLVPMRDAAGELWSLQRILAERPADGGPDKLLTKGGRKSGLMHWCGNPKGADVLLIAEGYATAASLHEATGYPACMAIDAGNLAHVARAVRGRLKQARILICGDDDRDTEARTGRNPSREKATEAAQTVRGLAVFPEGLPDGGSDFNDLAQHACPEAVRSVIENALQAAQVSEAAREADPTEKTRPAARQRPAQGVGNEGAAPRERFRVDDVGTWFDPPADREGNPAPPVRICGPLHVTALARDVHDNGAALLLEFDTPFKAARRWLMPLAMLAGDGTAYRAELLQMGFMVPTDAGRRARLTEYLQSRQPAELVRIVDRVGWHGRAYVLPRETLGEQAGERVLFQSEAPLEDSFAQRGTLAQWRERIGSLCAGNGRLAFAVSCALAGPLLAWASGTDGGGFHFVGDSSCGKTTALRVAASVWGGREYMQRWRATDNGIEAQAAQHSDALLCLDELAQLDPKVAGESAYMLANGQGKARAGRTGAARPRLSWRLLFLSAGEVGLADHMSEAGKRTRAGQELRMIDLPADAGARLGIFNATHGHEGGGALAQHLTRECERVYGTPGRAWLHWLVDHTEGLGALLRERMAALEPQLVPEAALGQVQRVGRRFALVAAAAELASEAGITGWSKGEAIDAARAVFNAWLMVRPGGTGLSEEAQALRQVRGWFIAHGEARFTDWNRADDDHAPKTMNRAGWRKAIKTASGLDELTGWEWFVSPDVFRGEICKGISERTALRVLDERKHVHREGKGYTCSASPPGAHKCRVIRVRSSILGDDLDSDA